MADALHVEGNTLTTQSSGRPCPLTSEFYLPVHHRSSIASNLFPASSQKRLVHQKKQKEKEKKELEALKRGHLPNMRVVQRNVVYVTGLGPKYAKEEVQHRLETRRHRRMHTDEQCCS